MKKLLVLVDFQNDFIDGSLGTPEAEAIVPRVIQKLQEYDETERVATLDTHFPDYLTTQEGKNLPVMHCQKGSQGWDLRQEAQLPYFRTFEKSTFGSVELAEFVRDGGYQAVELVGICTDICVVSNALLIKALAPEVALTVDAACCAGTSPEAHAAALATLKSCQVKILNEK